MRMVTRAGLVNHDDLAAQLFVTFLHNGAVVLRRHSAIGVARHVDETEKTSVFPACEFGDRLGAGVDMELLVYPGDVRLHGPVADVQFVGDFFLQQSFC